MSPPIVVSFVVALFMLLASFTASGSPVIQPDQLQQAEQQAPSGRERRIEASDRDTARFFESFMERKVEELEIPGAAVVVIRDGRTILSRGFGVTDLATGQPVDPDRTLFRAASISKLLPWLLALQLEETGAIDLDADITGYLGFSVSSRDGVVVTMRHLMTHTGGFPERFHGVFDPDVTTPLGTKLRQHRAEPVYEPGSTIAYANYGAALAGHVIERVHGGSWNEIVQTRLFDPLGMHRSTIAQPVPADFADDLASTYSPYDNRPAPFRTVSMAPIGSLTATATDMGRLLARLVDGARGVDGPVVSAATIRRMMSLAHPLGRDLPDGMGLGLLVGEYRGIRYAGHAGNMSTLATDMEVLPDHGLGWYYVLTSQGPAEDARKVRDELVRAAIDAFLSSSPIQPEVNAFSTATEIAGHYISTRRLHAGPLMFSGLMNTTDVIAHADGGLAIRSAGSETRWRPAGKDRFIGEDTGIPLSVTRDAENRVQRLASAALYPAAEFERPPAFARYVAPIAVFSFVIMLGAMIVRSIDWGIRRWRRSQHAAINVDVSGRAAQLRFAARLAFLGLCLMMLGWAGVGLMLAIDFASLFTIPTLVRVALGTLTAAAGPFALLLLADAMVAWVSHRATLVRRIGSTLLALAACGLALLVYALDVWNFSTDW